MGAGGVHYDVANFDTIIRNGTVLDGLAGEERLADVGISGDQIKTVGGLRGAKAERERMRQGEGLKAEREHLSKADFNLKVFDLVEQGMTFDMTALRLKPTADKRIPVSTVKSAYAGFNWDNAAFGEKMRNATKQLDLLGRTPKTIEPGHYRVFLAPAALHELLALLGWGAFGLKSHRTKQTALLKMLEEL